MMFFSFFSPPTFPTFPTFGAPALGDTGGEDYDDSVLCREFNICREEENPREVCVTKNGQKCVFPFNHKGKRYR